MQIIQAAAAFVAGIFITFSQVHDANIGMYGLAIISVGWCIAAIVAITKRNAIIFNANNATSSAWILIQSWGLFGALAELYLAIRQGKGSAQRRDHFINAGLAAALVVALALVTDAGDSVSRVGFFGAYAVILAVHLGIAAASPKAKA
jgi:hypothetical protein